MKLGLVGPSGVERSLPFSAQRTVNLFPVFDKSGKEQAALYGTPGLSLFATAGSGPIRGIYAAANGRVFAVSGNTLYEISSLGVATSRGTLNTSSGNVSITDNGVQLAVCDGTDLYILTYSSNVFAEVTDGDLPSAKTVTFIDGYFVVNQNSAGTFYVSGLYDGTTWTSLSFATAESSPDQLLRVFNAVGQLWLFGTFTTEIWTNTGDSSFPFQKISGAKMETGIVAPHTACAVDNTVLWLGRDVNGAGVVYRAAGFSPRRISTNAVEYALQQLSSLDDVRAFTYQEEGHVFYFLTGGELETSWVYDLSTDEWHERAYLNEEGLFEQHLAGCGTYAFNKHLVGDRNGASIYEMSLAYYSDNGNPRICERTYTHISDENKDQRYSALEIDFETGVGLQTGQGSDPYCELTFSKDGGRTWSLPLSRPIGKIGKYLTRVIFRRLGVANMMTFRVRVSDPVKVVMIGSYLR